ncbi:MAG: hypothetical protein ACE5E7_13870 [Anaerolineae bacterium]
MPKSTVAPVIALAIFLLLACRLSLLNPVTARPAAVELSAAAQDEIDNTAASPTRTRPARPTAVTPTETSIPSATPTQTPRPTPTATATPTIPPVRAVRVSFPNMSGSRGEVAHLQDHLVKSGINYTGLAAGRPDWTFFKWADHPERWSSAVTRTGIDFLAEDSRNFDYGHVDAVVDVFAPNFIAAHPDAAAVSYWGERSDLLVSTAALTAGPFHDLLLEMIEYIAANYERVDSISITELSYHDFGYGPDDLALYRAFSGAEDWPRQPDGQIDPDHPSVGEWRSAAVAGFLAEAAARIHPYGKQLVMDVEVSWGNLENEGREYGHYYPAMLGAADKILLWAYTDLAGYPAGYPGEIAAYLAARYDSSRIIISPGLWARDGGAISAEDLGTAVSSAIAGGIPHIWITPSHMMAEAHWRATTAAWLAAEADSIRSTTHSRHGKR